MSERSIILRKVGGFYQIFDDDALIINYFFNYRIVNYKCGFPISALNKVTEKLEENTINYIIKQEEIIIKDFKDKNNYNKYLEKSKKNMNNNKIINKIEEKLNKFDEEKLQKILIYLEQEITKL